MFVDLAGLIDKPAEIARNEKERAKLAQAIAAKQAKLSGGTFVERAPAEVVAKERASLAELEEKLAAIDRARGTAQVVRDFSVRLAGSPRSRSTPRTGGTAPSSTAAG
ncbi:MAG: hypothetical protein U0836_07150 [Pirellulales bacterium]